MLCQAPVKSDVSRPAIKLGTPFSAKAPLEALPEKESLATGAAAELNISARNCNVPAAKVGLQQHMVSN